jgi:hypothetical protein
MIYLLPLILLMFSIFIVLWVGDFYFTVKSTERTGSAVEMNPIMGALLKLRGRFLWFFKIAELAVFSLLVWVLSSANAETAFNVFLGLISLYSILVAQGINIYIKAVGNAFPVALVFFAVCVIAIVFIKINYDTFLNSIVMSDALRTCSSEYASIYGNCSNSSATTPVHQSNNSGFNFTIPR